MQKYRKKREKILIIIYTMACILRPKKNEESKTVCILVGSEGVRTGICSIHANATYDAIAGLLRNGPKTPFRVSGCCSLCCGAG
jgi:hypothetical protein